MIVAPIAHDVDRRSRSFQLHLSESKCSLLYGLWWKVQTI